MNIESLSAGVPVRFNVPGRYFRLIETTGPVSLTFYRRGADIAEASLVEAGYSESWLATDEGFEAVEVVSATAQAIKFAVRTESSLSYDRAVGNVAVTNNQGPFFQSNPTSTASNFGFRPANPTRRYLLVQHSGSSGDLWLNMASAAVVGQGIKIPPGGVVIFDTFCPTGAVNIVGTIAGIPIHILEGG